MPVVTVRGHDHYQTEIIAGDHVVFADEPNDVGGDDTGPNPYELLLGALGACTSITVRMYAQRKGWDVAGTEIELEHARNYAQDCADCADNDTKLDLIHLKLSLPPHLDAAQRQRLFDIAKRCPVNQTLSGGIHITHELVPLR